MNKTASHFDQSKLLQPFCEVNSVETQQGPITDISDLMKLYPGQFEIVGNFEGKYYIVTDPNVRPVQHPMRKTPIEYQEKIEAELDRMIAQGIITPVTEPTEVVNIMTFPMKPSGELCVCLDPKDLNKAIIREHYKAPPLQEITHKVSRATVFSKFDAYEGLFAYKLNKASSPKTAFNTTPRRG